MKILFLCSSNICRSPYAEYHFKKMVQDDPTLLCKVEWVRSAAVLNPAKHINKKTREVLISEGFSADYVDAHRPVLIRRNKQLVSDADLLVGMTKWHKRFLPKEAQSKFLTLSEAATGEYVPVPDPWLYEIARYKVCLEQMFVYFAQFADRIKADDDFFAEKKR